MMILILVILICSMERSFGLRCPSGIDTFAANLGNNSYYKCINGIAALESCDLGMIYNNERGLCEMQRLLKGATGSGKVMDSFIESDALGRIATLGNLYDARKHQIYNGWSLWSQKDLMNKTIRQKQQYSKTHFFAEQDFSDRASLFELTAELELSFQGGLIEVKGSAHYLRDSRETNEDIRVNMDYYAITESITIPHSLPLTHPKYCQFAGKSNGPTHVISSVTHGMRAVFVFQSTTSKSETAEEIGGSLEIAVKSIPSFQIRGSATIDVNGKEVKNIDTIEVKFYGDVILDRTPTTYLDAIKVFNELPSKVIGTETVIKFQLTPITTYCDLTETIIMAINANLIDQANEVLQSFSTLERDINSLSTREVSRRFPSIKKTFVTFKNGLQKYSNGFKADLAEKLPKLKAGLIGEDELIRLLNNYTDSQFEFEKAKGFLDHREREVNTIELVIQASLKNKDLVVTDSSDANDNDCIFNREFATIYTMHVLPTNDVAEKYLNGIKESNETKWYDDTKKVGNAGRVFQNYVKFASINKGDNHCFLIILKKLHPSVTISVSILRNGNFITSNFVIPQKPERLTCLDNGYDYIKLITIMSTNLNVKNIEVQFENLGNDGNWTGSLTRILANDNKLLVDGLKPKTLYRLQTRYITVNGHTAYTDFANCTTAPSSSPTTLRAVSNTSSTISLKWGTPTTIAPGVKPTYLVSISKVERNSNNVVLADRTTSTFEITLDNLEPATLYNIAVFVKDGTSKSHPISITHATTPLPPPQPTIEHILQNESTVVINLAEVKLAVGTTLRILGLKYYKMDDEGVNELIGSSIERLVNIEKQESSRSFEVKLNGLAAGQTYGIELKVIVNNINGISKTQYNGRTIFKTSYEKSALDEFRESLGLIDITSNVNANKGQIKLLESRQSVLNAIYPKQEKVIGAIRIILNKMGKIERLVSRDKAATQSSVYNGRGAGKAVDGVIDPYNSVTCSQTNSGKGNYWRVNLGQNYVITRVVIFNKAANRERLDEAKVYLEKPVGADVYIGTIYAHDEDTYSHEFKWHSRWVANGVKIIQPKITMLTLCQVEVYGYDA